MADRVKDTGPPAGAAPASASRLGAGDAYMIGAAILWGANFPISKQVLAVLDPLVFSALRYLSGALLLMALMVVRRQRLGFPLRDVWQVLIAGFVGIAVFQGLWAIGLSLTTAPNAAVLVAASPIFGALLSIFGGGHLRPAAWAGILLSFAGVALLVNDSLTTFNLGGGTLTGDLLMLGSAAVWAIYSMLAAPVVRRLGALRVTAWGMLFGALILVLFEASAMSGQPWQRMTPGLWAGMAASAVFASALCFVWYYEAVVRIGVTKALVYSNVIPVVAIVTSIAAFGATMSAAEVVGAAIVLLGINLARRN